MQKQKGFTLIEVMVALVVISVALVAVITAYLQLLNALRNTENYNQAVLISSEQMGLLEDEIRRRGGEVNLSQYSGEETRGTRSFKWEFTGTTPEDYPDLQEIQMTINWSDGKRQGQMIWTSYMKNQ